MIEGYVKFNCTWEKHEIAIPEDLFFMLQKERDLIYGMGLIGAYHDGIGYGNISVRSGKGLPFYITGSATGQLATLDQSHYALVTGYSFAENSITCTGLTKASAESLSHAAVYESLPEVGAVVHVHCLWLWEKLLDIYPTTSPKIEYGTPQMAEAIQQLIAGMKKDDEKIIVMGGHREGILAFGKDLNEASSVIVEIYNRYKHD